MKILDEMIMHFEGIMDCSAATKMPGDLSGTACFLFMNLECLSTAHP